jgi:voltage-gated potassium channel
MKRKLERILLFLRTSRSAGPVALFLFLFLAASIFMVLFEEGRNREFSTFLDGLWWTIITFSTTGYGDKVPITTGGRIIAVVTIFFGIGAMSLLSGTLASLLVERNTKARRGLMDYKRVRDHLVVCGWKEDLKETLLDILQVWRDLDADRVVLVSNVDPERVEALREETDLKGLKFVRGDYFSELALTRANVREARKVLILADTLESSAVTEVDSKTVMTVLTIRAMAKDVYICAEILDRKYESYLQQALCDEILYSRDFARQMIASSSATNGMSHIIHSLLKSSESESHLLTVEIPTDYVGKTYHDYRSSLPAGTNRVLIGLLENTGSPHRMKMLALREAQKTSDVSRLINNLQKVKELEVNRPVFVPKDEYVIQRHSLGIVLERVEG